MNDLKQIEEIFNKKFEHHKNNLAGQINHMHKELEDFKKVLENHEQKAAISQQELARKIDSIHTLLEGNQYDKESGFVARFKRIEAAIEILKNDKQFLKGGWWLSLKLLGFIVGFASFFILAYNFIKTIFVK